MFGSKFHPLRIMSGAAGLDIYNGKGGDTPATPNYTKLAQQQAQANLDLAKYTTQANRVNQVTPYGTLTYTQAPGTVDQASYDKALAQYNKDLAAYNKAAKNTSSNNLNIGGNTSSIAGSILANQATKASTKTKPTAPNIADYTTASNQWTATQTLSPEQQKILTAQEQSTQGALDAANAGLGNVTAAMQQGSVDMSKLPQMVSNVDASGMPQVKSSIDTSNLPSYGINPGETYSDAIMRRLQPQMAQQKQAFDTQMSNRGIVPGTQAYDNAYRDFQQGQNDLLTSAVVQGMNTGLTANQQQFGQNASQAALANAANQQLFGQGLSNAQLANAANQQAYGQAQTNLNNPINMFNALRSGSQVTNPSYVNPAQQANVGAADLVGAAQNSYNSQLGAANAANASNSSFLGGLMNLGGAIGGASPTSIFGKVLGF